jgi:hypothetical protein
MSEEVKREMLFNNTHTVLEDFSGTLTVSHADYPGDAMNTTPSLFAEPAPAQPEPSSTELRVRCTALPFEGRTLRVARVGSELILASGYSDDDVVRALAGGLRVPAALWPALAAAVDALLDDGAA